MLFPKCLFYLGGKQEQDNLGKICRAMLEELGGVNQAIFVVVEILHQILLELA